MINASVIGFIVFICLCVSVWAFWNKEERVELKEIPKETYPLIPPVDPKDFEEKLVDPLL